MSLVPECFLVDNGSLRAASTLSLRRIAKALSKRLERPVRAVSLLHSSGVDPAELEGEPAELLEPALGGALAGGARKIIVLPLFFGPSAAVTEYAPERARAAARPFPGAEIRFARWLVDVTAESDRRIAEALAARARMRCEERGLAAPGVVLVDHGSPQPGVGAVRDFLARQLRDILGGAVSGVWPASMERRAGEAYDFNEPLLESRLRTPPCDSGDVVVALQFLSPGRHAGAGGDIAQLCAAAEAERPGLRTHITKPLEDDPRIIDVLVDRYREADSQTQTI